MASATKEIANAKNEACPSATSSNGLSSDTITKSHSSSTSSILASSPSVESDVANSSKIISGEDATVTTKTESINSISLVDESQCRNNSPNQSCSSSSIQIMSLPKVELMCEHFDGTMAVDSISSTRQDKRFDTQVNVTTAQKSPRNHAANQDHELDIGCNGAVSINRGGLRPNEHPSCSVLASSPGHTTGPTLLVSSTADTMMFRGHSRKLLAGDREAHTMNSKVDKGERLRCGQRKRKVLELFNHGS